MKDILAVILLLILVAHKDIGRALRNLNARIHSVTTTNSLLILLRNLKLFYWENKLAISLVLVGFGGWVFLLIFEYQRALSEGVLVKAFQQFLFEMVVIGFVILVVDKAKIRAEKEHRMRELTALMRIPSEKAKAVEILRVKHWLYEMNRANFFEADLSELNLFGAVFNYSQFQRANLKNANLKYSELKNSRFELANLKGADFTGADISNCFFTQARFDEATNFSGAKIRYSDFQN